VRIKDSTIEEIVRTTVAVEDGPIVSMPNHIWHKKVQLAGAVFTHTRGDRMRIHFWGQSINADGKPGKVRLTDDIFVRDGEPMPDWAQEIMNALRTGADRA
jgi:hypothetical protein